MRDDQFSQSLEMLDNGCLPDSAVDAEDVLSFPVIPRWQCSPG
jgi:hypothetical protein